MKSKLTVFLLVAVASLLTACQAPPRAGFARFHGGRQADVVLSFNDWDYIFVTRPVLQEAGFARILHKSDLSDAFNQCHVPRDLAVVTIGWQYQSQALAGVTAEWKKILKANGFRRVAFVHGDARHLNRTYLIEDAWL